MSAQTERSGGVWAGEGYACWRDLTGRFSQMVNLLFPFELFLVRSLLLLLLTFG
jgi:hypothetical protein